MAQMREESDWQTLSSFTHGKLTYLDRVFVVLISRYFLYSKSIPNYKMLFWAQPNQTR